MPFEYYFSGANAPENRKLSRFLDQSLSNIYRHITVKIKTATFLLVSRQRQINRYADESTAALMLVFKICNYFEMKQL